MGTDIGVAEDPPLVALDSTVPPNKPPKEAITEGVKYLVRSAGSTEGTVGVVGVTFDVIAGVDVTEEGVVVTTFVGPPVGVKPAGVKPAAASVNKAPEPIISGFGHQPNQYFFLDLKYPFYLIYLLIINQFITVWF